MRYFLLITGFVLVLSGNVWGTDVWDSDSPTDTNATLTKNVLWHTAPAQVHDLQDVIGDADVDWYIVYSHPGRSYEVQVCNVSQSTAFAAAGASSLRRYNWPGLQAIQDSNALDPGGNCRTLRWWSATLDTTEERIRVTDLSLGKTANTVYTIKLYDTTLFCPRFNNAVTQVSVLIVQITDPLLNSCSYVLDFWDESGTLLYASGIRTWNPSTEKFDVDVINLSTIPELSGKKGSARMIHTCGYGGIAAKLVALEPATGFSFDTPCSYLPH